MKLAKIINLLFAQWNNKKKAELYDKANTFDGLYTGSINIFALDDALMEEYPEYSEEAWTMEHFIEHLVCKGKALEVKELLNI